MTAMDCGICSLCPKSAWHGACYSPRQFGPGRYAPASPHQTNHVVGIMRVAREFPIYHETSTEPGKKWQRPRQAAWKSAQHLKF